jgi:hypothetical protein
MIKATADKGDGLLVQEMGPGIEPRPAVMAM